MFHHTPVCRLILGRSFFSTVTIIEQDERTEMGVDNTVPSPTWDGLPDELVLKILRYVYHEDGYATALAIQEHEIRNKRMTLNIPRQGGSTNYYRSIALALTPVFESLFVSRQFLTFGADLFAKLACFKITGVSPTYDRSPDNIVNGVLRQALRRTPSIWLEEKEFMEPHIDIREFRRLFPMLHTINIFDSRSTCTWLSDSLNKVSPFRSRRHHKDTFLWKTLSNGDLRELRKRSTFHKHPELTCLFTRIWEVETTVTVLGYDNSVKGHLGSMIRKWYQVVCWGFDEEGKKRFVHIDVGMDPTDLTIASLTINMGDEADDSDGVIMNPFLNFTGVLPNLRRLINSSI